MSDPAPALADPDVYDVLAAMRMALSQLKLYPKASPQVAKVAGNVYQALAVYLARHDGLTLSSTPEGLLANGKKLGSKDPVHHSLEASLLGVLQEAGVRGLRVARGIAVEDLVTFLYALSHGFWDLGEGKAINARLTEEGVHNAQVDEVEYVAVGKTDVVLKDAAAALEAAKMTPNEFLDALDGKIEDATLDGNGKAMRLDLVLRLIRQDPGVLEALLAQDSPTGLVAEARGALKFPEAVAIVADLIKTAAGLEIQPIIDGLFQPFRGHTLLRPSMKAALFAVAPLHIPVWMREDLAPGQEPGAVRRLRDILALSPSVRSDALSREGPALLVEALALGRVDLAEEVVTLLAGLLGHSTPGQRRLASEALAAIHEALGSDAAKPVRTKLEARVLEVIENERDPGAYTSLTKLTGVLIDTRLRKGEVNDALRMLDILKNHSTLKSAVFPERQRLVMPALERVTSGDGYKAVAATLKPVEGTSDRLQKAMDRAAVVFLVSELKTIENLQERLRVAETISRLGEHGVACLGEEAARTEVPSEALRLVEVIPAAVNTSDAEDILQRLLKEHPVISVRRRSAVLLAERGFPRAEEILRFTFETTKDPAIRGVLIDAIGRLKGDSPLALLMETAESRSEPDEVRAAACMALGRRRTEDALPLLIELAARQQHGLTRMLRGVSPLLRIGALRGLAGFPGSPSAVQAIRGCAEDPDPTVRAAVVAIEKPTMVRSAPAAAAPAPAAAGLAGLLGDMPLETLMQSIGSTNRTGVLRITGTEARGNVYFEKGFVVAVEFGERKDVDAMADLLRLRVGAFLFRTGEPAPERRMKAQVQKLLVDAFREPAPVPPAA
ncbi:MAG TPA: HEAT repeat domain-containing protein [Planctomycetota bacterium]